MKEIYKNIFTFDVPLPKSALKSINIYVIKSDDRAIVFDTGYNTTESKTAMIENLKEIGLNIKDCDLFLTHLHADHTGLASFFYEQGARVFAGAVDGELINSMASGKYWDRMMSFLPLYDMVGEIDLEDNPGYNFKLSNNIDYTVLKVGEVIKTGDYELEIIDLKGHTPGHLGFYEQKCNFMFGADTVLDPITPNITFWGYEYSNILGTYIDTLKKVKDMNIDTIFSTHRVIIKNPAKRIDEIIHHHFLRLQEILDSMDCNRFDYTIREISKNISWNIRANDWDDFPKPQKWFATGETMSHMDYLVHSGHVEVKNEDGVLKFKKLKDKIL